MYRSNPRRARRLALTLLELVVVMTILIALAGILVAMFPGMLTMAHSSTDATNLPELNKIFQMHHQVQRGWPNYLDNLVSGSGLYARLPGYDEDHSDEYFLEAHALTHDQAHALRDAGLTHVFNLVDGVGDATYDCYGSGIVAPVLSDAVPVNDDLTVAILRNPSDIAKFKGDLDHVYVVFGIGQATPLVGPGGMMQDAPIHFNDAAGTRPNEAYSRFVAIFDLGEAHDDDDDGHHHHHSRARFVTAAALHRGGISLPWMALQEFHHSDHSH